MERLTYKTPADWSDCLACAGAVALARKAAIWMRSNGETISFFDGDQLLAVSYLVPQADGSREFCLSILPAARPHMLPLTRFAQSTLTSLAQNGVVVVSRVTPGNRSGERMARLCGFRPDGGGLWTFKGEADGKDRFGAFRWRGQQREEGSREEPAAAAGGERSPAGGGEPQFDRDRRDPQSSAGTPAL
jgi:hypothetical protein